MTEIATAVAMIGLGTIAILGMGWLYDTGKGKHN